MFSLLIKNKPDLGPPRSGQFYCIEIVIILDQTCAAATCLRAQEDLQIDDEI
jgi:hypothetical protein